MLASHSNKSIPLTARQDNCFPSRLGRRENKSGTANSLAERRTCCEHVGRVAISVFLAIDV